MDRVDVPEEVLSFIARRIDSVPHLETLLLLWENQSILWSEAEVSARAYVSREQARTVLEDLARHGLIGVSGDSADLFRYDTSWDQAGLMPKVAATYRRHVVHIASLIHAQGSSEAVRQFARAFRIKDQDGE